MSQRNSGYVRVRDEDYSTPPQPVQAVAPFLRRRGISHAWDPATGTGSLAQTLHTEGFQVTATTDDFLAVVRALSERFDLLDELFSHYTARPLDEPARTSEWAGFRSRLFEERGL